jgi:uncharacterized protein YdiU (UPF0061 family)
LGLASIPGTYERVYQPLLNLLQESRADFTLSFAYLEALTRGNTERITLLERLLPQQDKLKSFWQAHLARDAEYPQTADINPLRIPRNHQIEQVIKAAETGDFAPFSALEQALLGETSEYSEEDIRGPKPQEWLNRTFCGT